MMLKFFTKKEKLPWIILSLVLCMFCFTTVAFAQSRVVTGSVTDKQSLPLPGVSVTVKGTSKVVQTNTDGKFSITMEQSENVLLLTYIGFAQKEVSVKGTSVNVTLEESNSLLNEVVVVG